MTIMEAQVIRGMAKYDLNASAASRGLYLAQSTVWYYIYRIIEETGLDPRKFYDLCELLPRAEAVLEGDHGN